jgi:hypothetical protein
MRHLRKVVWLWIVAASLGSAALAQTPLGELRSDPWQPAEKVGWRNFAVSIAAHGAATGFDAWTSWQRPERNGWLADGGRFTASSAYKKAGLFTGLTAVEILVVKKWGKRHPWIERACRIANFTSAGMLVSGGVHNLGNR